MDNILYHIIYRVSSDSGRYYIGRHSTLNLDDGYIGSGKWVRNIKDKSQLMVEILEYHDSIDALMEAEERHINKHINNPLNMNFNNKPIGFATGELNPAKTEKVKKIRSDLYKNKTRMLTDKWIENIRLGHTGIKQKQETILKRAKKCAKEWTVISPKNQIINIKNLKEFCRNHSLDQGNMVKVSQGKQKHHKGWKCFKN